MSRRREEEINPVTVVIALITMFLIGKFLGLFKIFNIDPFGIEPEWVYGVIAIGIGVLYKEIRDLDKKMRTRLQQINDTISRLIERIVSLETIIGMKKK